MSFIIQMQLAGACERREMKRQTESSPLHWFTLQCSVAYTGTELKAAARKALQAT